MHTMAVAQHSVYPWDLSPRFDVGLRNPLDAGGWTWRVLPPGHPAFSPDLSLGLVRLNDPGHALRLISGKYGEPEGYCVLSGNVAGVSNWPGVSVTGQYAAVSHGVGAFPCGGMYYLSVEGPAAARVLDLLTPKRIDVLEVGQAAFAIFTTPEGTVDNEGVVLRDGEHSFKVSVGGDGGPPTWLPDAISVHPGTRVRDAGLTSFNLKGPGRLSAMAALIGDEYAAALARLRAFRGMEIPTPWGERAWIVRTVIGIEMWASPDVIHQAWLKMLADPVRYTPCGWDILATFRLECTEFAFYLCPLDIHRGTHLLDAGIGHAVSQVKDGPFIGRQALRAPRSGPRVRVAGLVALDPETAPRWVGEPITDDGPGTRSGYVTTTKYSPRDGRQLCFANLQAGVHLGDVVRFADDSRWRVQPLPMAPLPGA